MRRCCSIFLYAVLLFLSPGRVKSFPAAGIFGGQRGGSLLRQRTNRFRSAAITLGVGLLGLGGATVYIYSCALSGHIAGLLAVRFCRQYMLYIKLMYTHTALVNAHDIVMPQSISCRA